MMRTRELPVLSIQPPGTYDFFHAVLRVWGAPQLHQVLLLIRSALTALPARSNEGDASFWETHGLPVMLPEPTVLSPLRAVERLAEALAASPTAISEESARVVVLLAFAVDYRVARLLMNAHPETHGRMHTRPPPQARAFHFVHALGARAALKQYVFDVQGLVSDEGEDNVRCAWCHKLTRDIRYFVHTLWVTGAAPALPRPPTRYDDFDEAIANRLQQENEDAWFERGKGGKHEDDPLSLSLSLSSLLETISQPVPREPPLSTSFF